MAKEKGKEPVDPNSNGQASTTVEAITPSQDDLTTELQNKIVALEAALATEKADHAQTQADALALNGELQKKLSQLTAGVATKLPSIEIDGESYQCKFSKIKTTDGILSAEDICADVELAKKLIKEGSGMLRLVR